MESALLNGNDVIAEQGKIELLIQFNLPKRRNK